MSSTKIKVNAKCEKCGHCEIKKQNQVYPYAVCNAGLQDVCLEGQPTYLEVLTNICMLPETGIIEYGDKKYSWSDTINRLEVVQAITPEETEATVYTALMHNTIGVLTVFKFVELVKDGFKPMQAGIMIEQRAKELGYTRHNLTFEMWNSPYSIEGFSKDGKDLTIKFDTRDGQIIEIWGGRK